LWHKRKFGDSVRSKTDVAMVNEVLCKLLTVPAAPEAQALAANLEQAVPAPLFQPVRVGAGETACQAVALPGDDMQGLGGKLLPWGWPWPSWRPPAG
jgi:hypothetical protein